MIVQLLQFSSDPNLSCKMKPGWKPGWRSNSKCYFNLNALDKLQVSHIQEQSRNDEGNSRNNVCSSSGLSWDVSKTTSSLKTNNSETKNYLHEKKKMLWLLQALKSWQRDASVLWNFLQPSPNMCQRDVLSFMVLWLKQEEYMWAKENTPASTFLIYITGLGFQIICAMTGESEEKKIPVFQPWKL